MERPALAPFDWHASSYRVKKSTSMIRTTTAKAEELYVASVIPLSMAGIHAILRHMLTVIFGFWYAWSQKR